MDDICKMCNGTGVYKPRRFAYQCKYCNGTGKRPELVVSKEKRGSKFTGIKSILDLKRPADVLSIEYHIYPEQIHAVAQIRDAFEPFVMYLRTKHLDWARDKFNAALRKHRWVSDKDCPVKFLYYRELYNEIHKEKPYKVEVIP